MELFNSIQWGTAFYQLAMFIILLALLRKYALKPLLGVMEKRQQKIAEDLDTAEKNRAEAEKLFKEQQQMLEQARNDASQILENARVTSEKQAAEIIETAKQEAEQFKNVARAEMNREKEQAVEALRKEVGQLSVLLASKIIEKEIDAKQQEELLQNYLKEVGNKQWVQ